MTTIPPLTDEQLAGLRAEMVDVWLEVMAECDGDLSRASRDIRDLLGLLARHDAVEDQRNDAIQTVAEALGDIALGDTPRAQQRLRDLLDAHINQTTRPDAGEAEADGNLDPSTRAEGREPYTQAGQ